MPLRDKLSILNLIDIKHNMDLLTGDYVLDSFLVRCGDFLQSLQLPGHLTEIQIRTQSAAVFNCSHLISEISETPCLCNKGPVRIEISTLGL